MSSVGEQDIQKVNCVAAAVGYFGFVVGMKTNKKRDISMQKLSYYRQLSYFKNSFSKHFRDISLTNHF